MFKTNEQETVKAEELEKKKQEKELQKEYQAHLQQDKKQQESYRVSEHDFSVNENNIENTKNTPHHSDEKINTQVSETTQQVSIKDVQLEQLEKEKKEFEREREEAKEMLSRDDEINMAIMAEWEEVIEEEDQWEIADDLLEQQKEEEKNNDYNNKDDNQNNDKNIKDVAKLGDKVEKVKFDLEGTNNEFDQTQRENFSPEVVIDDEDKVTTKEEIKKDDKEVSQNDYEQNKNEEINSQPQTQENATLSWSEELIEEKQDEVESTSVLTKENLTKEQKETVDQKLLEQAQLTEELKANYEKDKQIIDEQTEKAWVSNQENIKDVEVGGNIEKQWTTTVEDEVGNNDKEIWENSQSHTLNVENIVSEQIIEDEKKEWEALNTPKSWLLGAFGMNVELPPEEIKEETYKTTSVFDDAKLEWKQIVWTKELKNTSSWREDEELQQEAMKRFQQQQINTKSQPPQTTQLDSNIPFQKEQEWIPPQPPVTQTKDQVDTSIEVIQKMMANVSYNIVLSSLTISTVVSGLTLMVGVGMWVVDMFYGFSVQWYYNFIFYSLIIGTWVSVIRWKLSPHE